MPIHNSYRLAIEQWPSDTNTDRRLRMERRGVDNGPPGSMRERRRGQERRSISVSEVRLSDAEWEQYFAPTPRP